MNEYSFFETNFLFDHNGEFLIFMNNKFFLYNKLNYFPKFAIFIKFY